MHGNTIFILINIGIKVIIGVSFVFGIYYSSHRSRWVKKIAGYTAILIAAGLFYANMIEPLTVSVYHETIDLGFTKDQPISIALIADYQVGPYKPKEYLEKIVNKVNQLDPDLVLIAGDHIYHAKAEDVATLLKPLNNLEAPTYAISGNHDYIPNNNALQDAFKDIKPHLIDDQLVHLTVNNTPITLIGLSDFWFGDPQTDLLNSVTASENDITILHNPDQIYSHFPSQKSDLTLAGHTHGGQMRIPYLYKYAIPTSHDFDWGLSHQTNTNLFITPGLGESGFPLRFVMPPQISLLQIK